MMIHITRATDEHAEAVWQIFREVIAAGDAYVFEADTTRDAFLAYWFAAHAYVAIEGDQVLGSYIVKGLNPAAVPTSRMPDTWSRPPHAAKASAA